MARPDRVEMARRGRIGALVTNGRYGGLAATAAARRAFRESFTRDAAALAAARGETLTQEEVEARGELLRRAHYARLARLSVHARRRSRDPRDVAA